MTDVHGELADTMRTELTSHNVGEDDNCETCQRVGRYTKYPCPPRVYAERAVDELARRADRRPEDPPEVTPMTQNVHAAVWRPSSFVTTDNCVEVANLPGAVALRDSRDPDGSVLVFSTLEWSAFVAGVRAGEFGE